MGHSLAPMPHWQASLLFFTLLGLCSAQNAYYIKPEPDDVCPGDPCFTLSEYANNDDFQNITLNTTLYFLPGNHTLEQTISVTNLTCLALQGDSSHKGISRILCTRPAAFIFVGINELYINALAFISCGCNDSAAVNISSVEQADISDCIFQNNVNSNQSNQSFGGAIYAQKSSLVLTGNIFQNNTAVRGGALYVHNGNLSLTNSLLKYNSAVGKGGALYVQNSTLIFTENTCQNNTAIKFGGALLLANTTLILTGNCTFQDNSADRGGVFYAYNCTLKLTGNSTFLGNSAKSAGGGLNVFNSSLLLTGNNTFRNSSATDLGGALSVYAGNITF